MASSVTCPAHDHLNCPSSHSYRGISTSSALEAHGTAISPSNDNNSDTATCYSSLQINASTVSGDHSRSVSDLNKALGDMECPSEAKKRQKASKHKTRPKPQRTRTVPSIQPVSDARDTQRSISRSTARSGHASRRSSLHSGRSATSAAKIPSVPGRRVPKEKRENLIALHREACQLFPNEDLHQRSKSDGRPLGSPTSTVSTAYCPQTPPDVGSPALSPVIRPQLSPSDRFLDQNYPAGSHGRIGSRAFGSISDDGFQFTKHAQATVIDWTSPSTRRREYEKIDRDNRGIRRLWQRVAPKWCQFGDRRTPFFEEGKTDDDGSVRRFRMDIPEEPDETDGDGRRSHHGLSTRQRLSSKINRTSKGPR